MRFRPCIDLREGKVTQIVGSSLRGESAEVNFVSDQSAAAFARLYRERGLRGGHVIMLGAGNEDAALEALRAFPGGLQLGGGVTPENARRYLEAGASHVIVTSYLFKDGEFSEQRLRQLVDAVGKDRLVIDLSCRRRPGEPEGPFYVVTDRWQRFTSLAVNASTLSALAQHCDEFLVHGVDVEGKRQGIEAELVRALGAWAPLPVTYAGGVRDLADIQLIGRLGGGRVDVTVGSALDIFGGDLKMDDVVALLDKAPT
jgi:phosphoribosylformimino-5-aminoimidazole carboxamide ribotide isomerase